MPIHSIEDTLDYFGYTAENDLEDNIIGLEHTKDKLHDEDELFFVIAPYVRSGSFIEMLGEDHYMWRWVFNDGTLEKITPKIEWWMIEHNMLWEGRARSVLPFYLKD